ncbi:hypothetical protein L873DRAFT_1848045 [Choiromyces venosus 120613-1]|uniref:Uncharacterized protein n=1 Tax=Choiromyces venosus 120613-1 TaxID=1336337 RepID=A0A3N4J3Y7_9PEZI|nr:hypothetical protein L873DRAFT_1848045 [Choiromyces venosus 120613-1]
MGEDFNGGMVKSKKMRVAQIHIACPICSIAGSFLRTLSDEVLWDEDVLKERLIEQFDDAEMDGQVWEDILLMMSTIWQGDHNVFRYSQKVLKLLRRKPDGLHHYDKILICYYINGLESQRLWEMAILSFLRADSYENPHQVVKGVMQLATQLRIKSYKWYGSDDDDDDDMTPCEESSEVDESDDNSESDAEVYYSHSRRSKEAKSEKKSGKKGLQKAATAMNLSAVTPQVEEDVIPLNSYPLRDGYRRYPETSRHQCPLPRYSYESGRHAQPRIYFHCQQEEHLRTHCPHLYRSRPVSWTVDVGPDHLDHPIVREDPPVKVRNGPVHAIEIVAKSSALHGMKVQEVTTVEVDQIDLMEFVHKVSESGDGDGDGNEEGEPVMAGEKFDFVGAFPDATVVGLNWGSFFDLAPMVKKDIYCLLVQGRAKSLERAKRKGKGKQVTIDRVTQGGNDEEEVLAVATDRNLGDVTNFYTKGTIRTPTRYYSVSSILVDADLWEPSYNDPEEWLFGLLQMRLPRLPTVWTYELLWLEYPRAKEDYGSCQYYIASSLGTWTSQEQQPQVLIVLKDRTTVRSGLSAKVEEELELQQSGSTQFFEDLITLIKQEADRQIHEENDEEEEDDVEEEESEN